MAATYKPSLDEVRTLAAQGNMIPVYRELPADLETPVSVYLKLCGQGSSNGAGRASCSNRWRRASSWGATASSACTRR
jgi:anthranilate synthase component 1